MILEFNIQGITYKTPKVPYAYDIAGTSLNKREQKWIRPDDIPMGAEISDSLFEREWERIINGYWFMCFGKPTFLTGYHYFFLTYYELENGERPDYRRSNRDFFYFWDYLEKHTKALGVIFVKFRREGASSRGASMMLNIGVTESRVRAGVISKTGTDAEDFFSDMVSNPFQMLPEWLKPMQSGNTKSKKELNFSKPATRVGKSGKVSDTAGGLNNRLMMRDTAMNSFDSGRMRFLVADECFGIGTKILMADMSFKEIQDIEVGDWVMTATGLTMCVCELFSGEDELFQVDQEFGISYIVNSKHSLFIEHEGVGKRMTPIEFIALSEDEKQHVYGVKSNIFSKENIYSPIQVNPIGQGVYYGIQFISEKENERTLLLEDFTISLNCGKFPARVPVYQYWQIVKKTLTQGGIRKGMCYMMSTVNEMEKGGGKQFRILWNMSRHLDKNGREVPTTSGLYSFFMPAYDGYLGYIDQYGESIIDDPTDPEVKKWLKYLHSIGQCPDPSVGAKNFILNKRKALERQIELGEITEDVLHEEIRTEPMTIKEAFLEPAKDCVVPVNLLNEQEEWLEENADTIARIKRKFNLYKIGDKVVRVDEPSGRWEGIWDFANPDVQANRCSYDKKGLKVPYNTTEFSIGLDPFAHNITVGSKGSFAGGYARRKYQPTDPENSDLPIWQYYYRPKLKSILWNDFMLACEYLGCKLACEDIMDEFATHFNNNGMENYYVWTPDSLMGSRTGTKKPGIPMSSPKAIEAHTSAIVEDFIHNYKKIYWKPLLEQLRYFDPFDRTEFDLVMGHGYSLLGAKEEIRNILPKENTMKMIKTYDIRGHRKIEMEDF